MTQAVFQTVKDVTGIDVSMCPWRPLMGDPFVLRVMPAHRAYESGNLAACYPDLSHRLIEGVLYYDTARAQIDAHYRELERENQSNGG